MITVPESEFRRLLDERDDLRRQRDALQARGTELIQDLRAYRRAVDRLIFKGPHSEPWPILLAEARAETKTEPAIILDRAWLESLANSARCPSLDSTVLGQILDAFDESAR